jgi:hypothetical protein
VARLVGSAANACQTGLSRMKLVFELMPMNFFGARGLQRSLNVAWLRQQAAVRASANGQT